MSAFERMSGKIDEVQAAIDRHRRCHKLMMFLFGMTLGLLLGTWWKLL